MWAKHLGTHGCCLVQKLVRLIQYQSLYLTDLYSLSLDEILQFSRCAYDHLALRISGKPGVSCYNHASLNLHIPAELVDHGVNLAN